MVQRHISRRKRVALGIVRGLLVVAFLAAGIAKLAGVPFMVAVFDHIGLGQWFRYVTGSIEIVGAILILTPRFVGVGGALLACTMGGAIISHLVAVPGSPVPAIVLLVLSATVAFAYRDRTFSLVGRTSNLKVA